MSRIFKATVNMLKFLVMNKRVTAAIAVAFVIAVSFQNCAQVKFSGSDSNNSKSFDDDGPGGCTLDGLDAADVLMSTSTLHGSPETVSSLTAGNHFWMWLPGMDASMQSEWSISKLAITTTNPPAVSARSYSVLAAGENVYYPASELAGLSEGLYVMRLSVVRSCSGGSPVSKSIYIPFTITSGEGNNCLATTVPNALYATDPKTVNVNVDFLLNFSNTCEHSVGYVFGDGATDFRSSPAGNTSTATTNTSHPYALPGLYAASAAINFAATTVNPDHTVYKQVTITEQCPDLTELFITGPSVVISGEEHEYRVVVPTNGCALGVTGVTYSFGDSSANQSVSSPFDVEHIYTNPGPGQLVRNITATLAPSGQVLTKRVVVLANRAACSVNAAESVFISGPTSGELNVGYTYSVLLPPCLTAGTAFNPVGSVSWNYQKDAGSISANSSGLSTVLSFPESGWYTVRVAIADTIYGTLNLSQRVYINAPVVVTTTTSSTTTTSTTTTSSTTTTLLQNCVPNSVTSTGCPVIANGVSTKTCVLTANVWNYGSCTSSCNPSTATLSFTQAGNQPNITCTAQCLNGNTNPTACTTPPTCTNGALNSSYPACNMFAGVCGSVNGTSVSSLASSSANVCGANNSVPSFVLSSTNNRYEWTCKGDGSAGTTVSCSAQKNTCANGATNPVGNPACDACPSGQVYNGTTCVAQNCVPNSVTSTGCPVIANGVSTKTCVLTANVWNYGSCTSSCNPSTATVSFILSGAQPGITCTAQCLNGNTNPTACTTPPTCTNGALNSSYPACNMFAGVCGSVNGTSVSSLASSSANVCGANNSVPSFVLSSTNNRYEWTCKGDGSMGTTVSCSAQKNACANGATNPVGNPACTAYAGACGTVSSSVASVASLAENSPNLCAANNVSPVANFTLVASTNRYTWSCQGVGGGSTVSGCSVKKDTCANGANNPNGSPACTQCSTGTVASGATCPVASPGVCASVGATATSPYGVATLCLSSNGIVGGAAGVTQDPNNGNWQWVCAGANTGANSRACTAAVNCGAGSWSPTLQRCIACTNGATQSCSNLGVAGVQTCSNNNWGNCMLSCSPQETSGSCRVKHYCENKTDKLAYTADEPSIPAKILLSGSHGVNIRGGLNVVANSATRTSPLYKLFNDPQHPSDFMFTCENGSWKQPSGFSGWCSASVTDVKGTDPRCMEGQVCGTQYSGRVSGAILANDSLYCNDWDKKECEYNSLSCGVGTCQCTNFGKYDNQGVCRSGRGTVIPVGTTGSYLPNSNYPSACVPTTTIAPNCGSQTSWYCKDDGGEGGGCTMTPADTRIRYNSETWVKQDGFSCSCGCTGTSCAAVCGHDTAGGYE